MENIIKLVLDREVLDEYSKWYFAEHPRATKEPITEPWHPSINAWFILKRPQMNALKQKWKAFMIWWINKLGYSNLGLDSFEVTQTIFFDSKRRHDIDNYVAKFIHDGWSESGFIVDDDSLHFRSLTMKNEYDKEHPRTEFEIRIIRNE